MKWDGNNPLVCSARRIVGTLRGNGHEAYWVGGCVRDALLGIEPHDMDVATDATPERVQSLFPKTFAVGAQFGVVIVKDGDIHTEVATFRSDGEYADGRRPTSVSFGTAEEDAVRRDFTINALLYDPINERLIDYVGGQADLDAQILRAIGEPEQRFREDALRLLRAVRFSARFGLEIEPLTWRAMCGQAASANRISAERIRDELVRIFTGPNRGDALKQLDTSGLLEAVLPEVAAMKDVPQPKEFHPEGDVFVHTRLALEALPPDPSPTLAMATLLHDVGKPATMVFTDRVRFNNHNSVGAEMADAILSRLRFSNAERKLIVAMVESHMRFMHVHEMRPAKLRQMLAMERFDEHLALHRADCMSSHRKLDNYDFCINKLEEYGREDAQPLLPPPLLKGDDLIFIGYRPGPRMGEILEVLREAQLNGEVDTPEAAREWVTERYEV